MNTPDEINRRLEQDEIDEALRKVRFADVGEGYMRRPKTLVDIETALEVCKYGCQQCYRCPYENILLEDEESDECCEDSVKTDALALIQQLQAENADQAVRIQQLEKRVIHLEALDQSNLTTITMQERTRARLQERISQLEAERDAAVDDLEDYATLKCFACKYYETELTEAPCDECKIMEKGNRDKFEWRGVQKEE